ncbi:MAG: thiamine pyrophosphate-dependent dehydrogenase E1 component subunit alpha [Chloroflexota bacterium]
MAREAIEPPSRQEPAPLLSIYRAMATARACDERMWILARQGRARFVVTGRGHEAVQAGSAAALRPGRDYALLYYRSMAVALTLGITPAEIMRSVLAREGDLFSGGRQLPNHFSSPALRIPTQSSSVAAGLTHAVGCAYAARVRGEDAVAACYFGEGATAKGDFHEALNFAAIHRLPVVFVCENNGWAISVPYAREAPAPVAARAAAYALPGVTVDGLDPVACYRAMATAVQRARAGDGPTLIEATCVRMVPHSSDDDDSYRDAAELARVAAADPLPRFRQRLLSEGNFLEAELIALDEDARAAVRAAEEQALAHVSASDAFSHLYAPRAVTRNSTRHGDAE